MIIKEFECEPVVCDKYPISITYNGIRFNINDNDWIVDSNVSMIRQWKETPILVL